LLKKVMETGRILTVKIETPANHLPEEARWDYRVTIRQAAFAEGGQPRYA
jgi:hypothetical protein